MSLLPSSFSPSVKQSKCYSSTLPDVLCDPSQHHTAGPACREVLTCGGSGDCCWWILSSWAPGRPQIRGFTLAPVSPVTRSVFMCVSLQRQIQYVSDGFQLRFLNWWPHATGGIAVSLRTFCCMTAATAVMSCLWPWCFRCWTDTRRV